MKNFKKILMLIFLCALINTVKAQSNNHYNLLQNKVWIYKDHEMVTQVYTINKSKTYYNGSLQMEESYYLSQTVVTEGNFDPSKIGVSINGKYIVTPQGCYEIISITNTSLVLKNIKQTHNITLFVN